MAALVTLIIGLSLIGLCSIKQDQIGINIDSGNVHRFNSLPSNSAFVSLSAPSPDYILANQPDFIADELFSDNEGFGGFSGRSRIAKKGNRFFHGAEGEEFSLITEVGKRISVNEENKTFNEIPSSRELIFGNASPLDLQLLASYKDLRLKTVGTKNIDGYNCLKIEVKRKKIDFQVFLYAAREFNYLIIQAEVLNARRRSTQKLINISLDVPGNVLVIPADYTPLPTLKWNLVKTAKVIYDGKIKKDSTVFRSEDGNQLYVTVYEPHPVSQSPYPWHYLVFLKEEVTNIAYQGLLTTKAGEIAWETKEKKAISYDVETPDENDNPCKSDKCPKTKAGINFVTFPSVDYDENKRMIRVHW